MTTERIGTTDKELREQLHLLQKMTETTGVLHEGQMVQLRIWPGLLFPEAKDFRLKINTPERKMVLELTDVTFGTSKAKKMFPKNMERFIDWCQELLGKRWAISVISKSGDKLPKPEKVKPKLNAGKSTKRK